MNISIAEDELVSFAEAAASLPGRPNVGTVWRWATKGCRGVRLEWVAIGRRRFTSRAALQRFTERCTAVTAQPAAPPAVSPARRKQIEAAQEKLRKAGI